MLESEIQGFDANTEVGHFLEIFTEAVNQNETAGGAENRRYLREILTILKTLAAKSPSQSDELLDNSSGLSTLVMSRIALIFGLSPLASINLK